MLHEFIAANRDVIISAARKRVESRPGLSVSVDEFEYGVPLFLTQLSETLRLEATGTPFPDGAIGSSAARHGGELLRLGFNVSQVVHDYGDICQTITELAIERKAAISVEEFHTLNRCVDTAIAEAVTEHTRVIAQDRSAEEVVRLGQSAHELRNTLHTALLAFDVLKRGTVPVNGTTAALLGRNLMSLREMIDRTLSEVHLAAGQQQSERVPVVKLLDELAATGGLHSDYRHVAFAIESVDSDLAVDGDTQLIMSALLNLLHNAFKNTPAGGHVVVRGRAEQKHLIIEVEDECGGIPDSKGDLFQPFGERRGTDRSGLGLGLSIARKSIRAHAGDIRVRNMPGKGCIFLIELPLANGPSQAQAPEAALMSAR